MQASTDGNTARARPSRNFRCQFLQMAGRLAEHEFSRDCKAGCVSETRLLDLLYHKLRNHSSLCICSGVQKKFSRIISRTEAFLDA
jgi:hypothetical protein